MANGFTYGDLPTSVDGLTIIDRDVAAAQDLSLVVSDARMAKQHYFEVHAVVWPDAADGLNNVLRVWFNSDNAGTTYCYAHRVFIDVATPATETPGAANAVSQPYLLVTPDTTQFQLSNVTRSLQIRLKIYKLHATGKYRIVAEATRADGAVVTQVPRHCLMYGQWNGAADITSVTVQLGSAGKMGAGSYLQVFGIESALLGAGYVFSTDELPSGKRWAMDGSNRMVFRKGIEVLTLPGPGAETWLLHGITDVDLSTMRIVEGMAYKDELGLFTEAIPMPDPRDGGGIQMRVNSNRVYFSNLNPGGKDYSDYKANVVLEYCRTL